MSWADAIAFTQASVGRRQAREYPPHYRQEVTPAALLPVELARPHHVHELEADEVLPVLVRCRLVLFHVHVFVVFVVELDELVDVRVQEVAQGGYVGDYLGHGLGRRRHLAPDPQERRAGTHPDDAAAGGAVATTVPIFVVDAAGGGGIGIDDGASARHR